MIKMDNYRKKAVEMLLSRNILVTPEMLNNLDSLDLEKLEEGQKEQNATVEVTFSYNSPPKKRECHDFVSYFNARFKSIESMLASRPELKNPLSISRLGLSREREHVSIIGMIFDKQTTKNGNIILKLEDQTGCVKAVVSKGKPVFNVAKDCVCDEVVGISGSSPGNGEVIFANNIVLPDVPDGELKKGPNEGYAIFLSDMHVGSNKFLSEDFSRFLKWISGNSGTDEQRQTAKKVKYIFISGDIVDGVGVYPNQEDELEITDIYEQYKACAKLLEKIPADKKLIISPGNHDSMRISEPQPPFYGDAASPIIKLPNVHPVSNPAIVNIDRSEDFPGFNVLMYHGYSFDYYVSNVESIRLRGGYDRPDLIMKYLLQRRHLAPSHSSTLYLPESSDNLIIGKIPDFFVTGHVHRASASHYKHITLISGSCWQGKTAFQEKLGHIPQPARVPIVDLKTREVKILKFGYDKE